MARLKWACLAFLLFLSLGVSSAGRVTVVDNDQPEKFVLGGHIGWQPGFTGGIIEGALGHTSPQTPPTPPPSPYQTSIAGARDEGYGGGQGSGYGRGHVGGISGGGSGGGGVWGGSGGGGVWGGGGGGGGWGSEGGGRGQDSHGRSDDCGDQSGSDCGDQSGGGSPGFTIPGFDIGGGISIGTYGGLYCTPIKCHGKNCKGFRLYFENSNDPEMVGIYGQKQNRKDTLAGSEPMDTRDTGIKHPSLPLYVAAAPPSTATPASYTIPPPHVEPPPRPPVVAAEPEPVDPLEQDLSVVPKLSPASD